MTAARFIEACAAREGVRHLRGIDARPVIFDANSAALDDAARAALQANLEILAREPELPVLVEGHCDGGEASPERLSAARAEAVARHLVALGLPEGRLSSSGLSASVPLVSGEVARDLTLRLEVGGLSLARALPSLAPAILQRIDGQRTLAAIEADLKQANPSLQDFSQQFAQLYLVLNGWNLLLLRRPGQG